METVEEHDVTIEVLAEGTARVVESADPGEIGMYVTAPPGRLPGERARGRIGAYSKSVFVRPGGPEDMIEFVRAVGREPEKL